MATIHPAAVAGMFYPAEQEILQQDVLRLLDAAKPPSLSSRPKVLIAPHAGYIYSGAIAANAYALLKPYAHEITRVVILGPAHRLPVNGLALSGADFFETPLGNVAIDLDAAGQIAQLPQVTLSVEAHAKEHSLEVHLPFLQTLLADFKCLPLAVGRASPEQIAEVLEHLWGGPETLIVISSDLSHFLNYEQAREIDTRTVNAILNLQYPISHQQACGGTPINGLMLLARKLGLRPHLLDVRNSGDTAGNKDRVVGYASFAFTEDGIKRPDMQTEKGQILLTLARNVIAQKLGFAMKQTQIPDWLREHAATFVTLKLNDQLRGCIGSLQAYRPLGQDVQENAIAAAFRDPRFAPLSADEYPDIELEVSLLSPPVEMTFTDEKDALRQLRPHIDGLIFRSATHRSTFLPQVWEQLPEPAMFMAHLKMKAGLAADFWSPDVELQRYTVDKWKENTDI